MNTSSVTYHKLLVLIGHLYGERDPDWDAVEARQYRRADRISRGMSEGRAMLVEAVLVGSANAARRLHERWETVPRAQREELITALLKKAQLLDRFDDSLEPEENE